MTKEELAAVRRLDVAWARSRYPFRDAQSEITGQWQTADHIAMMALHLARTRVGTKKQRRESEQWLREHQVHPLMDDGIMLQ